MIPIYLAGVFLLGVSIYAWRGNPNRRKNIDANITKIVSSKEVLEIPIEHASEDLENEYKTQFKGYPGIIEVYRDRETPTTLILARR